MTGTKWTVGWHDRFHGHGDYGVIDESETLIAKVETGLREDATLLAAAPELLAACEAITEAQIADGQTQYEAQVTQALVVVEAAIAKAKSLDL